MGIFIVFYLGSNQRIYYQQPYNLYKLLNLQKMIQDTEPITPQLAESSPKIIFEAKMKLPSFYGLDLAYDNTFVVWDKSGLRHVNKEGRKISELNIQNIKKFKMLSEDQVLILSVNPWDKFYHVTWWSLRSKVSSSWQSPPQFKDDYRIDLFIFKNTKIYCILQNFKNLHKLSYFKLPALTPIPLHSAKIQIINITGIQIRKLNEHSMIGFLPSQFRIEEPNINFYTYNLRRDRNQGEQKQHVFEQWLCYGVRKFGLITIQDIYEIYPKIFYIQIKAVYHDNVPHFFNFYWNSENKNIQLSKISFKDEHRLQFIHCIRQINTEMIRTIYEKLKQRKMVTNTPIYYIDAKTQKIIGSHLLKNKIKQNIQWPNFKSSRIMQYYLNEKEETRVEVLEMPEEWNIYWESLSMMCTFLMTELVADCEQDLIQFVTEMLTDEFDFL